MKNQKLSVAFILIFFISSLCTLKMNSQSAGQKLNLDLIFIGNSITEGAQLEKPGLEAPPAISCDYLRHQQGIVSAEFSNQGRSGYTTVDFLPSGTGAFSDVLKAAHLLHKDNKRLLVFSISLGTNDSAEDGPNGSPVSPVDYHKNLKSITDKLLAEFPGCKIIYQQPIWYSPTTHNHSTYMAAGLARLQSYFPELPKLVKEYSQSHPDQVFTGNLKGFEYFKINYLTDLIPESGKSGTFYLHPNKKGDIVLGTYWGESIYQSIFKNK